MRAIPALLLLLIAPVEAWAQGQVVSHDRIRRYAGEEVTVEGPVARVAPAGSGSLWFSIGNRAHPSSSLVIVVLEEFVKGFDTPRSYEGAVIQVYGLVQTGAASTTAADRSVVASPPGGTPRTPYIVLQDMSRFKVISRPDAPRPDTTSATAGGAPPRP